MGLESVNRSYMLSAGVFVIITIIVRHEASLSSLNITYV